MMSHSLTRLRHELPTGWTCFEGVGGVLYAKYAKASPPILVRGVDVDEVKLKVRIAEIDIRH